VNLLRMMNLVDGGIDLGDGGIWLVGKFREGLCDGIGGGVL
jgi:hypothetical protein